MSCFPNFKEVKLTEVELAIYQYIVEAIEIIPYMRIRELADNAHVSPSSILRFLKKMGYESFPEFKLDIKQKLATTRHTEKFSNIHFDILNKKNFNQDIDYQVEKVAQDIVTAESIIFIGMGSSGTTGEYAARKFANIGIRALAVNDPTYPLMSLLNEKGKGNLIIVLSTSGSTKEIIEALHSLSKSNQLKKIAITGNITSDIAQLADYVIDYHLDQERLKIHYDLTSQVPAVFILELLVQRVREILKET